MARRRGVPLRTRWEHLDRGRRRDVVVVAGAFAVLLVITLVGVAGRNQPTESLLASSPSTSVRPSTTVRGGPLPTTPARNAPAVSSTVTTQAGEGPGAGGGASGTGAGTAAGGSAGAAGGTTGSGGGGEVASSGEGGGARTSGVFGGIDPGEPSTSNGRGAPAATDDGPSSSSSTTTTTTTEPSPPPVTDTGIVVTVTRDDDGGTVTLARGDTLVVRLEPVSSAGWSTPTSDSPALSRTSTQQESGLVTARFTASHSGTAIVSATSTPTCTTATPPCLTPADPFTLTVNVTG